MDNSDPEKRRISVTFEDGQNLRSSVENQILTPGPAIDQDEKFTLDSRVNGDPHVVDYGWKKGRDHRPQHHRRDR